MIRVVFPQGILNEDRERAWEYVRAWWEKHHPTWSILVHPLERGFSKARSTYLAIRDLPNDAILIISDADVIVPNIQEAAQLARTHAWVRPHQYFRRLTRTATNRVLAGENLQRVGSNPRNVLNWRQRPWSNAGANRPPKPAGMTIMRKSTFMSAPGDPRFVHDPTAPLSGLQGEDHAWGMMLRGLHGPPAEAKLTLYHLWHPDEPRPAKSRLVFTPEVQARLDEYKAALTNPARMRALANAALETLLRGGDL